MGRRSKASKSLRRRNQRAKKRLLKKSNEQAQVQEESLSEQQSASQEQHEDAAVHPDESDCLGEDRDVVLMEVEDSISSVDESRYSYQYMWDCRKKLMAKVSEYRATIEEQKSKSVQVALQHRQEIERIRSFYQAMVYAPTRASKIFKASRCSTSTARQVLDQVGLEYRNDAYYCKQGYCYK